MHKKWHTHIVNFESHNWLCVCVMSVYQSRNALDSIVCHFLCICLLGCEGEFYFHCLPKVPGTQWVPNACLFSEWMKNVKIMNEKHPESCIWLGTNNRSTTEWWWRFTRAADSHSGGREGLLLERVSASTAPTTSSDPETLARKYMTSPQKLQRTGQLLSEGITQNPINYASCLQVTPGSYLPDPL